MTPKYDVDADDGPIELEPGDQLADDRQDHKPRVIVVEQTDQRSDEYVIYETEDGTEETIYSYHRGQYPADDPVFLVVYQDSIDGFRDRLEKDLTTDQILGLLRDLGLKQMVTRDGWSMKIYGFPRSRFRRVD